MLLYLLLPNKSIILEAHLEKASEIHFRENNIKSRKKAKERQ